MIDRSTQITTWAIEDIFQLTTLSKYHHGENSLISSIAN